MFLWYVLGALISFLYAINCCREVRGGENLTGRHWGGSAIFAAIWPLSWIFTLLGYYGPAIGKILTKRIL